MQQRYYDPVIGRFYSNDPVSFSASDPMLFNRYAYGNNNPYKYTDPDGEFAVPAVIAFAAVVGGLIGGAAEYMSNPNATMKDIGIAAFAGAAAGAATAILGMGLGTTILAGAGANGVAEAGKQLATTGSINKEGAVKSQQLLLPEQLVAQLVRLLEVLHNLLAVLKVCPITL